MCGIDAAERVCAIGKPAFAKGFGIGLSDEVLADIERMNASGATALVVTCGDMVMGTVAVADTLRPSAFKPPR